MPIVRRHTDYAIRVLLYLGRAGTAVMSCAKLVEECEIPKSFAHKILKRMTDNGFLKSRVGRSGGYRLGRRPRQISLTEVIETVQGPLVVSQCVVAPSTCNFSNGCPVSAEWRELQDLVVGFLSRTTLHDLLTAERRQSAGVN